MTIRDRVMGMADENGLLRPEQAQYVIQLHLQPFTTYCKETGNDLRAEAVLTWLGY